MTVVPLLDQKQMVNSTAYETGRGNSELLGNSVSQANHTSTCILKVDPQAWVNVDKKLLLSAFLVV